MNTPQRRTYATEFSPALAPEAEVINMMQHLGLEDTSWHNNSCPSWSYDFKDKSILTVFVQPLDCTLREFPESVRFQVQHQNPEGDWLEEKDFCTDSFTDLLAYLVVHLDSEEAEYDFDPPPRFQGF